MLETVGVSVPVLVSLILYKYLSIKSMGAAGPPLAVFAGDIADKENDS